MFRVLEAAFVHVNLRVDIGQRSFGKCHGLFSLCVLAALRLAFLYRVYVLFHFSG